MKAIWHKGGVFFHRKMDADKVAGEADRLDCPNYCNPQQLADFLNKLDVGILEQMVDRKTPDDRGNYHEN